MIITVVVIVRPVGRSMALTVRGVGIVEVVVAAAASREVNAKVTTDINYFV